MVYLFHTTYISVDSVRHVLKLIRLVYIDFFFSLESGNLALGRPTFASSVRDGHSSSRAVDGEFYISNYAYETCFASEYEISPWFMLELDRLYTITRVTIYTCGKFIRILYQ